MPWMRALHVLAIAAIASGCSGARASLDRVAEDYVRVALKLAQHDPSLVETWRGPRALMPGARVPVASIHEEIRGLRQDIDVLAGDIGSADERTRIEYLDAQLRGLGFAAERLLGRATTIDEQARDEFAAAFSQPDTETVRRTLAEIDRLLPGEGALADRVAGLRRRTTVPRDRRMEVLQIAVAACRDAVAPVLQLPRGERVTIAFRSGLPWDGFAQYAGKNQTAIEINDDGPLDVSRAFRLACHEGYAGHHGQHVLMEQVAGERGWPELQLTPAFGRHLLFSEGAAEVGADVALTPAQRATLYRERLMPAANLPADEGAVLIQVEDLLASLLPVVTDVARQYLDTRITREQAIERLATEALIANPSGTLAFIERRRARALVYGEGRRVIYSMMTTKNLEGLRALVPPRTALQ